MSLVGSWEHQVPKGSPRREGPVAAESVWVVLDLQAQGLGCGVSGSGELLKSFGPGRWR